jgi:hypothetical protein
MARPHGTPMPPTSGAGVPLIRSELEGAAGG